MSTQVETSLMFSEAAEAADTVRRQLSENATSAARIGQALRRLDPRFVTTVARGSSDHAASYAKYLLETRTGRVTASLGPSVASVYEAPLGMEKSLCLLISQSGASPDLLASAEAARRDGAYVVALVNVPDSPLAAIAHETLELQAGPERSVAATKSFIGSISALIQLVGYWQEDEALLHALADAPNKLQEAWECDWTAAGEAIADAGSLYVIGRGLGFGVASEAALKFKEVCGLHAEAFSAAEVMHGPVTIAREQFPVLVFSQEDATSTLTRQLVEQLAKRDVRLITAGVSHPGALCLPFPESHPVIAPLLRIQSFYRMVNAMAFRLGRDPDRPPFLNKVTATR